ncbi:MAG: PKD domain-containing protein [Actinobacteria bacterium]|nr:PKD domain-containing protein [Actinomycetota bacterium]
MQIKTKMIKIFLSFLLMVSFCLLTITGPFGEGLFADNPGIKVFIDAGHGGRDTGAIGFGFYEKTANLDIALRVKQKLEASGFAVVMRRGNDTGHSLDEIVNMANSSGADIFVSIHNNASLSPYSHGTETYWCANGVAGSQQLASLIQSYLVSQAGRANRGVKTANFRVIKYTTMPAALVECAFISNQTENDLLKSPDFREKCAAGIANAIKKFSEGIIKPADSGGSSSESTTTTTTDSPGSSYSDVSTPNSSGFSVGFNTPPNGATVAGSFVLRGWAADLRGVPAKKLSKIEIYKNSDKTEQNLIGKIENFETNVLGSQGVLDGGWQFTVNCDQLFEGENIIFIYAYDENSNYSTGNIRTNVLKSGEVPENLNLNPIAKPGGPYNGEIEKEIIFNGSASYDPDGIITEYLWDFGDGTTANTEKPVHVYSEAGSYTVTLIVKDNGNKLSAAVTTKAEVIDPAKTSESSSTQDTTADTTVSGGSATFENVSNSTNVTGYISITEEALLKIFKDRNSTKLERAARLAPLYIKYAKLFNFRADIAWAQMCHETGFLEFTGDVKPQQNNFVGLGATGGGVPGHSFATEELGVIAHFAHLAWYYFPEDVNEYCNKTYDPRHFGDGHINYTGNTTLGFLNGRWAPGATYTDKIILFANQIIQGIGSGSQTITISVTANAGQDKQTNIGESVTFDASSSIIVAAPDITINYLWDWNGDGLYDQTANTAVVKYVFETAGTFEVALKIRLSNGLESVDKVKVSVNSIPAADPGGPYSAKVGESVKFDGSKSKDSDGTIKDYLWDFGNGASGSGISPAHIFQTSGIYTIKLTVVDDKGASSTTVTTTAEISDEESASTTETTKTETTAPNKPPTANAGGPYSGKAGENITFDGSASSDEDGSIAEYIWDFGDGTSLTNGKMPTHAYSSAGNYIVKLTVKDDKGAISAESTASVTVNAAEGQQYPVNSSIITNSTSFVGYHEVTADQLVSVFIKRGSPRVDWARRLAPVYIQYGKLFNLRADIAWAQMIHETGFLEYTGDVKPNQNNFCGLGATGGGVPGNSFATEELGVIAHYAHLAWYYFANHVNEYCNSKYDPRHFGSTHSKYTGDTTVGFLNGRWAPGATYTDKILQFANQIYGY